MKQAMIKIHQEMGPNALIIKTTKTVDGVEVLTGLEEEKTESHSLTYSSDKIAQYVSKQQALEERLEELNCQIQELTSYVYRKRNVGYTPIHFRVMKSQGKIRKSIQRMLEKKTSIMNRIFCKFGLSPKIRNTLAEER